MDFPYSVSRQPGEGSTRRAQLHVGRVSAIERRAKEDSSPFAFGERMRIGARRVYSAEDIGCADQHLPYPF